MYVTGETTGVLALGKRAGTIADRQDEIVSHNSDGISTLQLPGGGTLRSRGQGVAVGLKAFVQAGEVKGEAPNLTDRTMEV